MFTHIFLQVKSWKYINFPLQRKNNKTKRLYIYGNVVVRDAYIWRASHGSNPKFIPWNWKEIKDPEENQVCLKFFFAFL